MVIQKGHGGNTAVTCVRYSFREMNPFPCRLLLTLTGVAMAGCGTTGVGSAPVATSAPAPAVGPAHKAKEPVASVGYLTGEIPAIPGPKRVVMVGKFDMGSSFTSRVADWDVGGGLSAMLVSALMESDRFVLVERAALAQVTAERELAKAQPGAAANPAPSADLTGAQFMILGEITEFGGAEKGRSFSLGIAGLPGGATTGVASQFTTGRVALAVRVVDLATGQIVRDIPVVEKVSARSTDFTVSQDILALGSNSFNKTPLGEACRRALTRVVATLAQEAAREPWVGRVVEVEGTSVSINAGSRAGLKPGDKFRIFRIGKILTDPVTGQEISRREQEVGRVEISSVEPRLATGTFTSAGTEVSVRGDHVAVLVGR